MVITRSLPVYEYVPVVEAAQLAINRENSYCCTFREWSKRVGGLSVVTIPNMLLAIIGQNVKMVNLIGRRKNNFKGMCVAHYNY